MMKQEDLFKKIGLILNELNNQYEFLAQNPQQLNELELELFLANANFLADHVQIIKKISLTKSAPLPSEAVKDLEEDLMQKSAITSDGLEDDFLPEEEHIEAIAFENEWKEQVNENKAMDELADHLDQNEIDIKTIEEEVFKLDHSPSTFEFILNEHAEHEKFEFEEKSVDELFNRPLSQEEENILAQKRKLAAAPIDDEPDDNEDEEDEIGPEPFLVAQSVSDFPIGKEDLELKEAIVPEINTREEAIVDPNYTPTLNDLLASKGTQNVNENRVHQVSDLKMAINLNDKLIYIKDLFNGYNLAYAEAIDLANKLPNFEAADNFFQKNYAQKNNWAAKQATVDKFYELLNQRFKG